MLFFFIGFMGSGKTSFAKKINKIAHIPFIDMDSYLQKKFQQTITEIFNAKGELFFRSVEQAILHELIAQHIPNQNLIIATGGGTPCYFDNMHKMNSAGKTIYFDLSVNFLFELLKNDKNKRPLINNLSDEELKLFIENKLTERKPFYQQAHICLKDNAVNIQQLLDIIKMYA